MFTKELAQLNRDRQQAYESMSFEERKEYNKKRWGGGRKSKYTHEERKQRKAEYSRNYQREMAAKKKAMKQ